MAYEHLTVLHDAVFEALVYVPPGTPGRPLPLLLYLHGAGEVGNDISQLLNEGATGTPIFALEHGNAVPELATQFVVVAPQSTGGWDPAMIDGLVDRLLRRTHLRLDPERCYVTGHSMGGAGALVAAATTNRFAACVPVAPAGAVRPGHLRVPVWCFHGSNDVVVPASFSERLVTGLRRLGADPEDAKLTLYPEAPTPPGWPYSVGHASTIPAYATAELYAWLLARSRTLSS